jgi:ribosomal protein S18 acetylase RimI-like enzyme
MQIREYNPATDNTGLHRCVEVLQDFEREMLPSMPAGADISAAYVEDIFDQCRKYDGTVLVAIEQNCVVGYTTIYRRMVSDELEDGDQEYAYIGDLVVLDQCRGKGYGRQLMQVAESIAREAGAHILRIGVLTDNTPAVALYQSLAFRPLSMQLEKDLT